MQPTIAVELHPKPYLTSRPLPAATHPLVAAAATQTRRTHCRRPLHHGLQPPPTASLCVCRHLHWPAPSAAVAALHHAPRRLPAASPCACCAPQAFMQHAGFRTCPPLPRAMAALSPVQLCCVTPPGAAARAIFLLEKKLEPSRCCFTREEAVEHFEIYISKLGVSIVNISYV